MRWASLAGNGTFTEPGQLRLRSIVLGTVSAGATATITDASAAGSTLSVAVIQTTTAQSFDFGGVILKNGLFAALNGSGSAPQVTIIYD